MPNGGFITLTARASASGKSVPDYGDALSVKVPVVPRGIRETVAVGGTVKAEVSQNLSLRFDTLPQGGRINVRLAGGTLAKVKADARRLFTSGKYGTPWAANVLKAAVAVDLPANDDNLREAFAMLSRDERSDGWGWWEGAHTDAKITAEVAYSLCLASRRGYRVSTNVRDAARISCEVQYRQTNLWEDRARLAASLALLGSLDSGRYVHEVIERGQSISPFARLRLAESLLHTDVQSAHQIVEKVLPMVSESPTSAKVPEGDGIGWGASERETSAELLLVLHQLNSHEALQTRLAHYLSTLDRSEYLSGEERAAEVLALAEYSKTHPDAHEVGAATVTINGHRYSLNHSTVEESASIEIRDPILKGGDNELSFTCSGDGEASYELEAHFYRPRLQESIRGVRITRRYEVRNAAGVWAEVSGPIKPGEPVRCTVVVWGDDLSDALNVTEPLPAGFEFIDSEANDADREEVRDGAVIHYLINSGTPTYFRYYIRAESDGEIIALPATAEYLRRPDVRGNGAATDLVVHP